MTSRSRPACSYCKHFNGFSRDVGRMTCKAFPEGIPDTILLEGNPHDKPVEGDGGITFSARSKDALAQYKLEFFTPTDDILRAKRRLRGGQRV